MATKSPALNHFHDFEPTDKDGIYKVSCKHYDILVKVAKKSTYLFKGKIGY